MTLPRSPLFPDLSLGLPPGREADSDTLIPQLPETPAIHTSSFEVYIVPAEETLFVQGFKPAEYESRPPTLLRGLLVLRVLKPSKIKSITLSFKGFQKTEWPEGIPPKRANFTETNSLVNHSWPFYQSDVQIPRFGADIVIPPGKVNLHEDVSHLSLDPSAVALRLSASDSTNLFAASLIKKATSPLSTPHLALTPLSSYPDLHAVLLSPSLFLLESIKAGAFPCGSYVYNFEHPLPALSLETTQVNFGSVNYYLEAQVVRNSTFRSNLSARLPITVVRIPSDNSVEENEPIVIERDWEDQLRYEIVVGSKSVVLNSYLPMSFKFVPLDGKIALHRIRVYLTEDRHYYCANKAVHRSEPSRRYLLLEHKAGKNASLLLKSGGAVDETAFETDILPRELEFQVYVPSIVNKKYEYGIHPDTAIENIQCHHWIKISLRISKQDPETPTKRKHFEISIDSPIHIYSSLAAHQNTLLPVYSSGPENLPVYTLAPPMSPDVIPVVVSPRPTHGFLHVSRSLAEAGDSVSRVSTPIEFHHMSSRRGSNEYIQRDDDMHLESNLFKPEDENVLSAIGTPQAVALSPVISPMMSPVRTVQEPSNEPPLFGDLSVQQDTLPPAYHVHDPNQASIADRLKKSDDGIPPAARSRGIKNKLSKQLERRGRSGSDRDSLAGSTASSKISTLDSRLMVSEQRSLCSKNSEGSSVDPIDPHAKPVLDWEPDRTPIESDGVDITDIGAPRSSIGDETRHSSIEYPSFLIPTSDLPLDQTIPLLASSVPSAHHTRLSTDSARSLETKLPDEDLTSGTSAGNEDLNALLVNFKNSRLVEPLDLNEENEDMLEIVIPKPRQKSFGVHPKTEPQSVGLESDSVESNNTVNEGKGEVPYFEVGKITPIV